MTEKAWLNQIPSDRPVLIIAEGLLYYLTEDEVKILLKRLVNHFPGGQITFDTFSTFGVRMQRFLQRLPNSRAMGNPGVRLKWGLNNPHEIEEWMPQVKLITELSGADLPDIMKMSEGIIRQMITIPSRIPQIRRGLMMLRYQF